MEQSKIGKFIAAMRKEQSMTQRELADVLNISDKTVSKWECGNGLPDVALMLPLCEALHINVNELLSGERLNASDYQKKAEENMMDLIREREESKKKIVLEVVVSATTIVSGCALVIVAGMVEPIPALGKGVLIALAALVIISGISVAVVLDQDAGAFECPKCERRFQPNMKEYVWSVHTIKKRKLKCPCCGETNYCRKVLTH